MTDLIITEKLNNIRMDNAGKFHSKDAMIALLADIPYKRRVFGLLLKDHYILRCIEGYTFSNTPIHNLKVASILNLLGNIIEITIIQIKRLLNQSLWM